MMARFPVSLLTAALAVVSYSGDLTAGEVPYKRACAVCHDRGMDHPAARGAPRLGDIRAWEARQRKGAAALAASILNTPYNGIMMPRGDLSDEDVLAAVKYLLEESS